MKKVLAFLIVSFSTRLALGVPALQEGFESETFPPPGWTKESAGLPLPHAWHRTTDPDYRGAGLASAFVGAESPSAIDEWLITPVVTLAATDKTIKFSWSGSPHWSSVLDASLNIREAGVTDWTRLWSIAGNESPADPFVYRERFVDLSAWTGKKVEFGFRVVGKKGASFGLDDVAVGNFVPADELVLPVDTTHALARDRLSANPWRVVKVRQPWAEDVPFETRTGYLRPSIDANNVPGPDSLVAHVVTEKGYRPRIVIERMGTVDSLLCGCASLPRWSPDGRYMSCVVWKSVDRPYELMIVDVTTGAVALDPEVRTSGTKTKWSPDSRTIAASGAIYDRPGSMLYTVSIPEGKVTVLDSVNVFATHEFSWSPDGRWIAFSRPIRVHHYGDTMVSDLWIAEAKTGKTWRVLEASGWAESNPLWITNRAIQVDRIRWNDDGPNDERRVVVELRINKDAGRDP